MQHWVPNTRKHGRSSKLSKSKVDYFLLFKNKIKSLKFTAELLHECYRLTNIVSIDICSDGYY